MFARPEIIDMAQAAIAARIAEGVDPSEFARLQIQIDIAKHLADSLAECHAIVNAQAIVLCALLDNPVTV